MRHNGDQVDGACVNKQVIDVRFLGRLLVFLVKRIHNKCVNLIKLNSARFFQTGAVALNLLGTEDLPKTEKFRLHLHNIVPTYAAFFSYRICGWTLPATVVARINVFRGNG